MRRSREEMELMQIEVGYIISRDGPMSADKMLIKMKEYNKDDPNFFTINDADRKTILKIYKTQDIQELLQKIRVTDTDNERISLEKMIYKKLRTARGKYKKLLKQMEKEKKEIDDAKADVYRRAQGDNKTSQTLKWILRNKYYSGDTYAYLGAISETRGIYNKQKAIDDLAYPKPPISVESYDNAELFTTIATKQTETTPCLICNGQAYVREPLLTPQEMNRLNSIRERKLRDMQFVMYKSKRTKNKTKKYIDHYLNKLEYHGFMYLNEKYGPGPEYSCPGCNGTGYIALGSSNIKQIRDSGWQVSDDYVRMVLWRYNAKRDQITVEVIPSCDAERDTGFKYQTREEYHKSNELYLNSKGYYFKSYVCKPEGYLESENKFGEPVFTLNPEFIYDTYETIITKYVDYSKSCRKEMPFNPSRAIAFPKQKSVSYWYKTEDCVAFDKKRDRANTINKTTKNKDGLVNDGPVYWKDKNIIEKTNTQSDRELIVLAHINVFGENSRQKRGLCHLDYPHFRVWWLRTSLCHFDYLEKKYLKSFIDGDFYDYIELLVNLFSFYCLKHHIPYRYFRKTKKDNEEDRKNYNETYENMRGESD